MASLEDLTNPTPCNQGLLADMMALASQLENPVPPYPTFFSTGQCGSGAGLEGSSGNISTVFPSYFEPFCQDDTSENCLRVVSRADFDTLQRSGAALSADQYNVMPGQPAGGVNPTVNVSTPYVLSWYVPPGFEVYFYRHDVSAVGLVNNPVLRYQADELEVNACVRRPALSDGSPLITLANTDDCTSAANLATLQWHAPFLVVVQTEEFYDLLLAACTRQRPVAFGPNSLNRVWAPQTAGCDALVTNACAGVIQGGNDSLARTCACFVQQKALDAKYGASLQVSACCFGQDASGNIARSCLFDNEAYRTKAVLANCCSFAECNTIVRRNSSLRANTPTPGSVECNGKFVTFPPVPSATPTTSPTSLPHTSSTERTSIPVWVWYVVAGTVLCALAFIVSLAFVFAPVPLRAPNKPGTAPLPRSPWPFRSRYAGA